MKQKQELIIHEFVTKIDQPQIETADRNIRATNDIDSIKIWLNEFIDSPNTFISYKQTAERFLMWALQQGLHLKDITREDIQVYQEFLQSPTPNEFWCGPAKPRQHKDWKPFVKGLAPSSVRLNLQILTTMFDYLIQSGYLTKNPFKLIKRKAAKLVKNKTIEHYLTHKELRYILDYIEKMPKENPQHLQHYNRVKWIFSLLYLSGCRRSEIINAKMSDFFSRHQNWWLKVIGKGNKYGEIPVTNDLLSALLSYRRSIGLPDFPNPNETNIPLVNGIRLTKGKLTGITDSMLYKVIKNTCNEVANEIKLSDPASAFVIERVSTHWLRHTSATHQVDAGIDIRVVKENLRHSLLETTMRYQHTESDARHNETSSKFGIK